VVRTLPRSSRARATAALLAASVLLAGTLAPIAAADQRDAPKSGDLKVQKKKVQRRIAGAHEDLDESSAQLRSATTALQRAQTQLSSAQAHLAETRGQLAAARVLDAQMAEKLKAAQARLERARADLVAGRAKIAEEQDTLGQIVVQNYQGGDPSLLGLSMVLTTQNPAELTGQLNSVQNVIDKESVILDRLEAARALLTVQQEEVQKAEKQVALERRAAAENLLRKRGLESEAEAAEVAVQDMVDARAEARQAAERAKAADLAQLANLETERDRIAAVLKKRADEARARAAAAARAAGRAVGPILGDGGPVGSNGYLNYPVSGSVTSAFGWRIHPIYGYRSLHDGIDFGADCGTPIRAAASGRVIEEYFQTAWGNRIIIDHGYRKGVGLATISNHLSSYAVRTGEHVERGQVVGYVGTTGWSTGCHPHFTVMQNGVAVDPMSWF
jgi:murein DD-endopeptidase MepM/ murein hydrolase activator NlpD